MTKKNTMKTATDQELAKTLLETRATLRTERFAAAGSRPKDSSSPRKLRATIARGLTEQHARALQAAK
jgi:ribosomal protein L29